MLSFSRCLHKSQAVLVSRQLQRTLSSQADGETRITHILKEKFPSATSLKVVDISVGSLSRGHIRSRLLNYWNGMREVTFGCSSSVWIIGGGCGAMYEVHIESNEFKGKRTVQQHQLVNQALKEEIQGMHGLRIFTDVPRE